ncbi:MAG: ribonuclease H-like domain-containing protein [Deltaproteobacteria bacterium]
MLKNTFLHIPGIGVSSERRIWDSGILSWDDSVRLPLPPLKKTVHLFKELVEESFRQLEIRRPRYFTDLLPAGEHWRLFGEFRKTAVFLDVESNGYAGPRGYITAISLYDGNSVKYYIRGENLEGFRKEIAKYDLIVTYNGRCFDVPFIESHLGIKMEHAHIDLRYVLRDLGFKGGLKGCERALGIERGALDGLDGYFAVLLWKDYRRNKNVKALETLLAYNILDVVNLEPLLVAAYNMKLRRTPFSGSALPSPASPELPFSPDTDTIRRILRENSMSLHGQSL